MVNVDYDYCEKELIVLRRLWECQKDFFLGNQKCNAGKLLHNKKFIIESGFLESELRNLWKNFRAKGVHNLLNGGPDNLIGAYEDLLYPSEWVSDDFEINGCPYCKHDLFKYYS